MLDPYGVSVGWREGAERPDGERRVCVASALKNRGCSSSLEGTQQRVFRSREGSTSASRPQPWSRGDGEHAAACSRAASLGRARWRTSSLSAVGKQCGLSAGVPSKFVGDVLTVSEEEVGAGVSRRESGHKDFPHTWSHVLRKEAHRGHSEQRAACNLDGAVARTQPPAP